MKQKVVINVSINDEKARAKAMTTAVGVQGVEKAAVEQEKNQIEVIGDGVDAVLLTTLLRKRLKYAKLESVSLVEEKNDAGSKTEDDSVEKESTELFEQPNVPIVWSSYGTALPQHQFYEIHPIPNSYHDNSFCSVM